MKCTNLVLAVLAVLALGLSVGVGVAGATTTWSNGTAGYSNSSATYTPVIGISTTETEAAPSSLTAGHAIRAGQPSVVVTVKAHVIVNASGDAGIYDSTDATSGLPLNTFGPAAKLRCWVLDQANGNTTWTRFPSGDVSLEAGSSAQTVVVQPANLPAVSRFALVPYASNVPVKVTYSER